MAQRRSQAPTYSQFDDLSLDHLRQRPTEKWRHYPEDVLPAFVAEMDFPLAPAVNDALIQSVRDGATGYAWASPELSESLASFVSRRFGWELSKSGIVLVPDVMIGITEVLRAMARPGDGVVINPPVYPPFFSHIGEAGCRVIEAPLAHGERGYELDFDALERGFKDGGRFYLLCNPHNPTGCVFTRSQLIRIAELADRYDVTVLADEIHAPLVPQGAAHVPYLSLGDQAASRAIAFVSASKGWNIPGLKCAQAVAASGPMREVFKRLPEELVGRVGNLGVIATTAAYRDGVGWLDQLLRVIDRNRLLMADLLHEQLPAVRYRPPQGTYLAWLDCRALGLPTEPVDFFLEHGRVALGPGRTFGSQGAGFVRITMATSEAILRDIVERMSQAVRAVG